MNPPHPQGGPYPAPQAPPPHGAAPRPEMPGTVLVVRVLMFVGGISGLILGGIALYIESALAGGEAPILLRPIEDAAAFEPGSGGPEEFGRSVLVAGAVTLVYGVVSTLLASFMGKRSPGILWGAVAFQVLATVVLVLSLLAGESTVVPLVFTLFIIAMMLGARSRAFYKPVPPGPV
ncbi:hypothetical protein IDM40_27780, partial [Nocardiopsis sp. HNM0947]